MTSHFTKAELQCRCGCGMLPEKDFMDKVEALRLVANFPFRVTSAARCASYNAKVSSTGATGPHTTGRAIDIAVRGKQAFELIRLALELRLGFTGIGVQQKGQFRFVHLDDLPNTPTSPRPTIWSY